MYVNRANNEISDETYNKLSPTYKVKYTKVKKSPQNKVETPKAKAPKESIQKS